MRPLPPEESGSEEAAKEAALRILGRSPRTEREIRDRLRDRGFSLDAVEGAVRRLRRVSLLDDRAFVLAYARSELLVRPQGRRRLVAALRRRGVPPGILAEIDELLASEPALRDRALGTEAGRAVEALRRLRPRYERGDPVSARRRLGAALARRGFDLDIIRDLLEGHHGAG